MCSPTPQRERFEALARLAGWRGWPAKPTNNDQQKSRIQGN
jgi:hypothetical protein